MRHPHADGNPIELSNLDEDFIPSCWLSSGMIAEGGHDVF